jgi:hypothetical protein
MSSYILENFLKPFRRKKNNEKMNVLLTQSFPEEPDNDTFVHQLRFNGDRQAFMQANILDFIALLPLNAMWLSKNILATRQFTMIKLSIRFQHRSPVASLTQHRCRMCGGL